MFPWSSGVESTAAAVSQDDAEVLLKLPKKLKLLRMQQIAAASRGVSGMEDFGDEFNLLREHVDSVLEEINAVQLVAPEEELEEIEKSPIAEDRATTDSSHEENISELVTAGNAGEEISSATFVAEIYSDPIALHKPKRSTRAMGALTQSPAVPSPASAPLAKQQRSHLDRAAKHAKPSSSTLKPSPVKTSTEKHKMKLRVRQSSTKPSAAPSQTAPKTTAANSRYIFFYCVYRQSIK